MDIGYYCGDMANNSGNKRYLVSLLENIAPLDNASKFKLFTPSDLVSNCEKQFSNFSNLQINALKLNRKNLNLLWYLGLEKYVLGSAEKCDIFHAPNMCPYPPNNKKVIASIMDIAWFHLPFIFSLKNKLIWNSILNRMKGNVHHFIAISESTKNDMVRFLKIDEKK